MLLGLVALAAVVFAISRLTGSADTTTAGANPSTTPPATSPVSIATTDSSLPSAPSAPSASPVASGPGTSAAASTPTSGAPSSAPTAGTAAGPAGSAAAAGTISSTGTVLLSTADSSATQPARLAPFVGQPAVANAATVQSVPADEGFWVGSSPTNRVWVQLTGGGESPETVTPGDRVSFTGTVTTNPAGFAAQTGVDEAEGAGQLTTQGGHIAVPATALTLSR